ncbi:DUF6468 domain-containing protein [Rhodopila sp.]|uniref:DUF6468 domain-containing protein n=1 Tax=Rhodopila sp. TaxID=2480087 RepID=UPI003D0ECEB9
MTGMQWSLEIILVVLLGATLFQAMRLERALGVLKRDRASLEALVAHFNASTQQAEGGIQRLRAAVDSAGRQIETQLSKSVSLKDDLAFLSERGERIADRLDALVRTARPLLQERGAQERGVQERGAQERPVYPVEPSATNGGSQVERNLLQALRLAR